VNIIAPLPSAAKRVIGAGIGALPGRRMESGGSACQARAAGL